MKCRMKLTLIMSATPCDKRKIKVLTRSPIAVSLLLSFFLFFDFCFGPGENDKRGNERIGRT